MANSIYSRDRLRQTDEGADSFSFCYKDYNRLVRDMTFDRFHVVRGTDIGRLELIAYTYFQDINLWWFVAYSNGIVDPFNDMYEGQKLRIPSQESIDELFKKASSAYSNKVLLK